MGFRYFWSYVRSKRSVTDRGAAASHLMMKEGRDHFVSDGHGQQDGNSDEDEHERPGRAFWVFGHNGTSVERVTEAVIRSALNHILKVVRTVCLVLNPLTADMRTESRGTVVN